jgi:peptidoglycan/LPS O-acetylase OafA/YrhL
MDLQQVLWMLTALGAFVAFAALVMLLRGRGREPGVVALVVLIGALLCVGGFLLSSPRYRDTSLIAGGAAVVGVLAALAASSTRPSRRRRPGANGGARQPVSPPRGSER